MRVPFRICTSLAPARAQARRRAGVVSDSKLEIRAADADMYFAVIDDRLALKLGPRMDMGGLAPRAGDGWKVAVSGRDFCVWEREAGGAGSNGNGNGR